MRFIILGDLHYATYSKPEVAAARDRFFNAFFGQVAAHQADIVFAIGDVTQHGSYAELQNQDKIETYAGLKLVRLVGNHDADSLEKAELAPYFLGGMRSVGEDGLYTAFTLGDVRFVLLDTARVKESHTDYGGIIHLRQLTWLKNEIAQFNAALSPRYLAVMAHHPITNTTHRSEKPMLSILNSSEVQQVLAQVQRKPAFYFCGHNHSNSIFGPDANGWYHVQAGAPLETEGYRVITVKRDFIKVETVDIDFGDSALRADFDLIRYNFDDDFTIHDFTLFYGNSTDREFVFDVS
ncbi:MAG: metallophosphoesterase [Chloroflexi bacterium]|uniref:Metallophosphoesterase n=1 Tax=Candidatus Chlorohelix allophototropha TaxID=3003348 RepID=A0A8T7LY89_9CHLR|nr:metallophosphoesterase [Chloroflexota bacterium]WJW66272.1 metallophosphoesterase [Chloroflexota bacterium L227-S17]